MKEQSLVYKLCIHLVMNIASIMNKVQFCTVVMDTEYYK